jgi:hypothetical protein
MLPERSKTSMTSRVTGGGEAGTRSARMFLVGQYASAPPAQGLPLDNTPTIRPAVSNRPDPELPPETCTLCGTVMPLELLPVTVAKPCPSGIESFFTAPLGWWIPNTCSPGAKAGRSCRNWIAGMPAGASAS